MKAFILRFEPWLVFGVVLALALWEMVSLYRHGRRRRRKAPLTGGQPAPERAAELERGA